MILIGKDSGCHAVALDIAAPYRLFCDEYNELYVMVIGLGMGLAAHIHIEKAITVLELGKVVLRAFALLLDLHSLHGLATADQ